MAFEQRSLDDYIDVAQRIADFRAKYPEGTLRPWNQGEPYQIIQAQGFEKTGDVITQTFVVVVAAAYRTPHDMDPGVGMAWEIFPGRTPYTRGSELQNAETSAWGRAIIAVGASDSKRGIASREEVRNRQAERDDGLPTNADGSLSRSRTTDEEKAAAGVMTDPQQRAHNALRRSGEPRPGTVEKLGTTPDDDPFYVGPVERGDPVTEDTPGTCTNDQKMRLARALTDAGFPTPDQARAECARIIGRDIASRKDLSYVEAQKILAAYPGVTK